MRNVLFTLVLYATVVVIYGQEGNVFLQNYIPDLEEADSRNWAISQGGNGVMYFANNRGILAYDGVRWRLIATPGTPYALAADTVKGTVYVGCKGDFGYLEIDETGKEVYQSISDDREKFGEITKIAIAQGNVFFYSSNKLYRYGIEQGDVENSWVPGEGEAFAGLVVHDGSISVNTVQGGLCQLGKEALKPLSNGKQFAGSVIVASIDLGGGKTLVCTSQDRIFSFDGMSLSPFHLEAVGYLKESHIVGGVQVSEGVIALGTLTGGCVLIDAKTGNTMNIINYQTGLPDDEVFAIGHDRNGGLWIAHEYGITRADFELPVTSLSAYNGLQGNLIAAAEGNGKVYVATTVGVFQLARLSTGEVAKYTKQRRRSGGKVDKFFSKLFGSKRKRRSAGDAAQASFYALQSVRYGYKPVKGIDDKCREIMPYKGMMLAATNSGLYSISGLHGSPIIRDSYIHFIYRSLHSTNRFYAGTHDGLVTVHYSGGWRVGEPVKGIERPVFSIAEDGRNHLWLGCENEVVRITLMEGGQLGEQRSYPIESNFAEQITVRSIKGVPMFFSHSGVYSYDKENDQVFLNEQLSEKFKKSAIVFSQDGHAWLYNGIKWSGYNEAADSKERDVVYINVVDDVLYIYSDDNNNCWVVDSHNGFYKVQTDAKRPKGKDFYLTTREAKGGGGKLLKIGDLKLTYDNSAVRFTFTSPFYLNEKGTRYQYFLDGVMEDWSEWDDNAIVAFPYLPEGRYELYTKAKNVFGEITEGEMIKISVVPPYYRRWWFYLLEIILISVLLFGSILLNANEESTALSKTLTFLTFIIIYKMLTVIVKYSFGSSFFFDLIVAIILAILVHKAEDRIIEYAKSDDAKRKKKKLALWWYGKVMRHYMPAVKRIFRKG